MSQKQNLIPNNDPEISGDNRKKSFDANKNRRQSSNKKQSFIEDKKLERGNSILTGQYEDLILHAQEIQQTIEESSGGMQLTRTQSQDLVKLAKQNFQELRQSTSLQTILAITNTMVGSSVLVLPNNFLSGGFILSFLVMTLIGIVSYYTCLVIVRWQKDGETDFGDIILRVLGKKWSKAFSMMSFLLLFIAGIVYFLLQNQVCYPFINFFLYHIFEYENQVAVTDITFSKFSVQWQCLILIIPIFLIVSMKELSLIIKMAKYGVIAIIAYFLFIFYIFFQNVSKAGFQEKWETQMKYFTTDFGDIAGTFSLAFFLHNCVCQITASNQNPDKNERDLKYGYINVYIAYGIVGMFGAVGILGIKPYTTPVQTICQFFPSKEVLPMIVNLLFLLQLSTVLPIICFISRNQFFSMILGTGVAIPRLYFIGFNLTFVLSCVIFQILTVSPSIVIGIDGAICGFFIVYIMPFVLEQKKYALSKDASKLVLIAQKYDRASLSNISEEPSNLDITQQTIKEPTYVENTEYKLKKNKIFSTNMPILKFITWIFILSVGITMAVLQIIGIAGFKF